MGQKASALGLVVALGAIGIGTTITMSASTPFSSAPARDLAVPVVAPSDAASLVVDAPSEAASLTVPEPSVAVSALPSSSEEAPSVPPAPHGAPSRSPSSHAAKTTGTRGPESSDDSTLGRELARIAAARNALTEGDATRTLQLLDAYDAEFPRGTFSVEVSVLRIEALARAGRTDEAAQLGNRFLARYPEGVLARRVATTLRAVVPREPAKESKTDR
jgi:hypothetical protein